MAATYEPRSMIVTTNIEFSRWGTMLGDDKLANATVDRIVHHGHLIEFGGQSRRFDEALMMGHSDESEGTAAPGLRGGGIVKPERKFL